MRHGASDEPAASAAQDRLQVSLLSTSRPIHTSTAWLFGRAIASCHHLMVDVRQRVTWLIHFVNQHISTLGRMSLTYPRLLVHVIWPPKAELVWRERENQIRMGSIL